MVRGYVIDLARAVKEVCKVVRLRFLITKTTSLQHQNQTVIVMSPQAKHQYHQRATIGWDRTAYLGALNAQPRSQVALCVLGSSF
jgi:CMP-2-keto-3-deoxyoctulosonic acid synthetase